MRTSSWLLFLLIAGACKGEPFRPDAKLDARIDGPGLDAFEAPWWTPMPGEAANWDIQLADPIDVTTYRAMYDVDLWQVTPAKTITYADTTMVMVPAGAHAGLIDTIHAKTPRPIVVCYLRVGTVNLVTDPDRMRFPGFPNPPDNPTPPVANSVIGWSTNLPANERWLDIRPATRGAWAEVLEKRIQLAKDIGCDGIDLDRTIPDLLYGFGTPNVGDMKSFLEGVAGLAHERVVSAGFRGTTAGLSDQLDDTFDWMVIERCAEQNDCEPGAPLIRARKAVFAIDYEGGATLSFACSSWANKMFDGILKQDPPAGNFRMPCP